MLSVLFRPHLCVLGAPTIILLLRYLLSLLADIAHARSHARLHLLPLAQPLSRAPLLRPLLVRAWAAGLSLSAGVYVWARACRALSQDSVLHPSSCYVTRPGLVIPGSQSQESGEEGADTLEGMVQRVARVARLAELGQEYDEATKPTKSRFLPSPLSSLWGFLWSNGDLSTVLPAVSAKVPPAGRCYTRFTNALGTTLDWAHAGLANPPCPSPTPTTPPRIFASPPPAPPLAPLAGFAILLPGVGGSSSAAYVVGVARALDKKGWRSLTIGARGLGDTPSVPSLLNIFDPNDLSDVSRAVHLLDSLLDPQVPVILVGFSLGGIMANQYAVQCGDTLSPRVKAIVSVSGAFRLDFFHWDRYRDAYQRMIVPNLVADALARYGHRLGELASYEEGKRNPTFDNAALWLLSSSTTYKELISRLLLPLQLLRREVDMEIDSGLGSSVDKEAEIHPPLLPFSQYDSFPSFQLAGEACPHARARVRCPLLLLCALDDPLHQPDLLGVPSVALLGSTHPLSCGRCGGCVAHEAGPSEDAQTASNIAYLVTERGGHVGWPRPGCPQGGFEFMSDVIFAFAQAATSEA